MVVKVVDDDPELKAYVLKVVSNPDIIDFASTDISRNDLFKLAYSFKAPKEVPVREISVSLKDSAVSVEINSDLFDELSPRLDTGNKHIVYLKAKNKVIKQASYDCPPRS